MMSTYPTCPQCGRILSNPHSCLPNTAGTSSIPPVLVSGNYTVNSGPPLQFAVTEKRDSSDVLHELLRDACHLLNRYAELVIWEEGLREERKILYERIREATGVSYVPDQEG